MTQNANASKKENTKSKYKDTIFLPSTSFSVKAKPQKNESIWLEYWDREKIYDTCRNISVGRPIFCLHDGPPYANGHLHIGHALNKILKDFVVRSRQMMGYNSYYTPGWDCHGLPIEWKVEENYRKQGIEKSDVSVLEFREECRKFASYWIDIQYEEFRQLGVTGDWKDYYTTMAFEAEATIAEEFLKFAMNGSLYLSSKPVMWSIAEETALADAETEYYDHVSPAIFVKFPLALAKERLGHDACIVIWTTTPWTIPANRAVAFSPNIDYAVHRIDVASDGCLLKIGEHIILAQTLTEEFMQKAHVASWTVTQFFVPSEDDFCFHPLAQANDALNKDNQAFWGENIPLLTADFVTDTVGTGFVHIAPSHGIDDYKLGLLHKLSMTDYIDKKGAFSSDVPIFSGHSVFLPDGTEGTANSKVMELLTQLEKIAGHEKVTHSYPHSWRSKTPLIFRNTPQWFIDLDTLVQDEKSIREKALSAIDKDVRWIPEKGRNRIYNMVANRPDWVVSRQRTWGVPLCCFVNKDTRQLLKDEKINERIVQIFRKEGADAWFQENSAQRFLAPLYNPEEWEKVTDILDVWFDSGSTHAFVLEKTGKHTWPASLYLEGTDQHRGWFHSSLIESCATRGKAPYEAVLTHGFVLDNNGEKMSKSKGNIITPQEIIDTYGTDIMRLWIAQSDFSEDLRVGTAILKSASDTYYRVRNIMRYLIGSLQGFEDAESVHSADMPELERYTLHRVVELDTIVQQSYEDFLFQRLFSEVFGFCSSWLSAFYFDVRKDSLYCDPPQSITRRSYRTVLNILFNRLVTWLSPIMPFMAEEVWQMRHPESPSVHLQIFPNTPDKWKNSILDEKWHKIREVRRTFDAALESERTEQMKSSSDVFLVVHLLPEYHDIFDVDFSMICLTSGYKTERIMDKQTHIPNSSTAVSDGFILELKKATGEKCARCRKILPEVGTNSAHDDLCTRCIDVIENKYNN